MQIRLEVRERVRRSPATTQNDSVSRHRSLMCLDWLVDIFVFLTKLEGFLFVNEIHSIALLSCIYNKVNLDIQLYPHIAVHHPKKQKYMTPVKVLKSTAPCTLLMFCLFSLHVGFKRKSMKQLMVVTKGSFAAAVRTDCGLDHLTSSGQQVHASVNFARRRLQLATESALSGGQRKSLEITKQQGINFYMSRIYDLPYSKRSTPSIVILFYCCLVLTWNNPGTCLIYGCHMSSHTVLEKCDQHLHVQILE